MEDIMTTYVENLTEGSVKLPALINDFSKVAGYKINIKNYIFTDQQTISDLKIFLSFTVSLKIKTTEG